MSLFPTSRVPIPTKRQFFARANDLELLTTSDIDLAKASDLEPLPNLEIDLIPQIEDAWCYAACAEMVINFCRGPGTVNKCEVASFVKHTNCCAAGDSLCTESGCDKDEIQLILERWKVAFRGSNQNPIRTITLEELTAEIEQAQNPIEIVVDWLNPKGSHALVLSGVLGEFVYILDPLIVDTGWKSYDYLLDRGGDWNWDRTWLGLRKREVV